MPSTRQVPGAIAWVTSGIVVDAALWWTLIQFPSPGGYAGLVAMAVLLCWSHVILLPHGVWLGRMPGWGTLGAVIAGGVIAAVAVGIGFFVGLVAGFMTFFVVGIPGFFVGGAVTGGIAAALARLLPASPAMVSRAGALLGGSVGPVLLIAAGYDRETNFGGLLAMVGSGIVASVATVPCWRSPWSRAGVRWALTAGVLALVVAPGLTIRIRHTAAGLPLAAALDLSCPGWVTPDCLAKVTRLPGTGRPRSWLASGASGGLSLLAFPFLPAPTIPVPVPERVTRERAEVEAAVDAVAAAARAQPDLAADLAPLESLPSPVAVSTGLAALADNLSGLPTPLYRPLQVGHLMPGRMTGLPTLCAVAERWPPLLPSLPLIERRTAALRLARLLADLGERGAGAQVLAPFRTDTAIRALDWLTAGDGALALLTGARTGRGELADVAIGAVGLLQRQGGPSGGFPDAGFWTLFRDTFPARLAAVAAGKYNDDAWADIRALISTLWRLGDVDHAREFADAVADQSRSLGTENGYALAAATYMDIGEAGPAADILAVGVAALPSAALTCPAVQPAGLDWRACTLKDYPRQLEWLQLAVQSYRLDGQLPEPSLGLLMVNKFWPALIRERLAAGLPLAWLDDRLGSAPLVSTMLLRTALDCWAYGDMQAARSLLALAAKRLSSPDAVTRHSFDVQPAFMLAAALGDDELQLAFARVALAEIRSSAARGVTGGLSQAAAFWRENLSDEMAIRATQ